METFKGAEVPPINELLERTHYVKALRKEIKRLTAERDDLRQQLNNPALGQRLDVRTDRLRSEIAELRQRLAPDKENEDG